MGKYDKKPAPRESSRGNRETEPHRESAAQAALNANSEYQAVAQWLTSVKFRKKSIGGYDPEDVWKKLDELNTLYENALLAERARYNLLLRQAMARENAHGEE